MSYSEHFLDLIDALQTADPKVSDLRLSEAAGLNKNWLSDFRRRRRGVIQNAEAIVDAIRRFCPPGPDGDDVRAKLAKYQVSDQKPDAAA